MGIFNYVDYKADCWKCGKLLKDFQTKDGEITMDLVIPKQIGYGKFYTMCSNRKCRAWNEFNVIPKGVEVIFNEKESKTRTK